MPSEAPNRSLIHFWSWLGPKVGHGRCRCQAREGIAESKRNDAQGEIIWAFRARKLRFAFPVFGTEARASAAITQAAALFPRASLGHMIGIGKLSPITSAPAIAIVIPLSFHGAIPYMSAVITQKKLPYKTRF
jgi:hypothetical protein